MAKFTVAFADTAQAERISQILRENGYDVFRVCTNGSEVIRAFSTCEDGIVICGTRLTDYTAGQLAETLGDNVEMLVLGRPEQLSMIDNRNIFKLSLPLRKEALLSTADILSQLHYQKLPHRTQTQDETVTRAKQLLMQKHGMSEKQAHQFIQKTSMRNGMKMEQTARHILEKEKQ